MDRRTVLKSLGVAGVVGVGAIALPTGAQAVDRPRSTEDPLEFVTATMTDWDVARVVAGDDRSAQQAYVQHVRMNYRTLTSREKLRETLAAGGASSPPAGMAAASAAFLPIIPIVGRALLAAARRYGPAVYRSLRDAVRGGYGRFQEWTRNHPWVAGILGGVSSNAVYDWLRQNI